jgi:thiol-disulfide isomerase/thioredoxin
MILRRGSLALLLLLAGTLLAQSPDVKAVRRKAPELAFNIPGIGQQLLSSYRGKVVSLEFIYTTCVHCQRASQIQKRLQEAYGSQGFQAIDVAINPNADLLVENFVKDFGLNFPVGWTNSDQAVSFLQFSPADRYVIPQIVVIDRKGYIRAQTTVKGDELQGADAIRMEPALTNLVKSLVSESTGHAAERIAPSSSR